MYIYMYMYMYVYIYVYIYIYYSVMLLYIIQRVYIYIYIYIYIYTYIFISYYIYIYIIRYESLATQVRGASGLVSADFMGKSDPYCIVEAEPGGAGGGAMDYCTTLCYSIQYMCYSIS